MPKKPPKANKAARAPRAPETTTAPESQAAGKFRNRNVATRRVRAGDLVPHPKNWRKHSVRQAGALKGILDEVGYVGTLLVREHQGGLQLIDGHLRAETMPDDHVDVMVVDLNDKEVDLILATHDPVGDLADGDVNQLDALLAEISISSGEVESMLSDYMDALGGADPEPVRRAQPGDDDGAEYPLVPVFNEKYEYALIFCKNDTEWGALQTLLNLQRQKSYKSTGVAIGRVVPATTFFELWEARHDVANSLPDA